MEKLHTEAVTATIEEIPSEKLSRMLARTLWGLCFMAFGIAMGKGWIFANVPVLVAFGTVIFGAVMASGQLMLHPAKLLFAMLRDLLAAWRTKGDT